MWKARRTSKKAGKRRARRAQRRRRQTSRVSEFASAKQTLVLGDDSMNNIYILDDTALFQFDRLSQIAHAYQYYRIKLIEMRFRPYQDTFFASNSGSAGTASGTVPYFYYLIDTGETQLPLATTGFNQLADSGAKAIRFDDKTVKVSWKPRVPIATAGDSTSTPGLLYSMSTKKSPWLPTNNAANMDPLGWQASRVPHKAIYYGVETQVQGANNMYGVEITVHCEFKKPLAFTQSAGPSAIKKVVEPRAPYQPLPPVERTE